MLMECCLFESFFVSTNSQWLRYRKTNVAMLAVASHFRDVGLLGKTEARVIETGKKAVYIAPMKALAQEVVEKFSAKLKPLGLIVRELTGDMQLTRAEADSANVLVTTPGKFLPRCRKFPV
jgi:activating signal cointegrator complex subunit 3